MNQPLPARTFESHQPMRFTVDDVIGMDAAGLFPPDRHFELIEGEIIELAPQGPEHAAVNSHIVQTCVIALQGRAVVWSQSSVRLNDISLPEPDVAIVRGRAQDYRARHPQPQDLLLVIEISLTSLKYDQSKKLEIYAQAGVPEVWIVNLVDRQVEVYRAPAHGRYSDVKTLLPPADVKLAALPDVSLALTDIFG
jgi:Uma2 family endonuclease